MSWTDAIGQIATTSVAIGIVGWLARSLISKWLDQDFEKFKHQLSLEAQEHSVQYQSLHLDRAQCIRDIYKTSVRAIREIGSFAHPAQPDASTQDSRGENAERLARELIILVRENLLYFDPSLAQRLYEFSDQLHKIIFDALLSFRGAMECGRNPYTNDEWKDFGTAWEKLRDEVQPALRRLEDDFRRLLGVRLNIEK